MQKLKTTNKINTTTLHPLKKKTYKKQPLIKKYATK